MNSPVRRDVPIEFVPYRVDVTPILARLYDGGDYWNRHKLRTEQYVHSDVSDIWVRFREWDESLDLEEFNTPHESVWYPIADEIPELKYAALEVFKRAVGLYKERLKLGGVLVTKVPPGGQVAPHVDQGWHATHYDIKHALQILGCDGQSFNFNGYSLAAHPGEIYEFDNSQEHWVVNKSPIDRITMIVCMRRIDA